MFCMQACENTEQQESGAIHTSNGMSIAQSSCHGSELLDVAGPNAREQEIHMVGGLQQMKSDGLKQN